MTSCELPSQCFEDVMPFLRSLCLVLLVFSIAGPASSADRGLKAGAAAVDVTPPTLPVIINGYFNERTADKIVDRQMARSLVLDDGSIQLSITVVDNLMIPRQLLDDAKEMASKATGIPTERMLISATHTHSAASAMGALGSRADAGYCEFLPSRIAASITAAHQKLVPARIGWTVATDAEHNHCRRWIFRPDRMPSDPFGVRNVRAHMHPGYQSPNHIGPSGPADTDLSLLSVQTIQGQPLCVLGNYAMHYYGAEPLSADFCGRFGDRLGQLLGATGDRFVGIMSQGTSGDSMWMDYSQPQTSPGLDAYTDAVARVAYDALQKIEYHDAIDLAMAEAKLRLGRRVPDAERLAWARDVLAKLDGKRPQTQPEIYAEEQIHLHETPEVEIKLQAIRIGGLGIVGIPDEVYGLTGLKIKAQSPLQPTFVIELANGAEGYIPPPEQHKLGGYTTWAARTAGLEVQAEPKIVASLLELLETVSGKTHHPAIDPVNPYAKSVLSSKPVGFWRLGDMAGAVASDATGKHPATYEAGVAFYLPGPDGDGLGTGPRGNRAAHFAGGRVVAQTPKLGPNYTVELWCWNGLPADARPVTGYFFSYGPGDDSMAPGDHLGIGGTHDPAATGKLILYNGNDRKELLAGTTELPFREWLHVALVRDGETARVYLNGKLEIEGTLAAHDATGDIFLGGRCDNFANLEGKLDEAAIFDRALKSEEIQKHYQSARTKP
jgi:hypothetical protein